MPRSILSLALIGALLASALPARAQWSGLGLDNVKPPEMKYGPVEVHPYLKLSEIYDSNIFLQPESKVAGQNANNNTAGPVLGSWIHSVNVGAKVAAQLAEMHRLDLAYDGNYRAYSKNPSDNNTYNQGVDGMYSYNGPMGLAGHLKDTYVNTMDPATSEQTQRIRRWFNTAAFDLQYAPEGGNFFAAVDAAHTVHKYVQNPTLGGLLNRYEQMGGAKLGYMLGAKTRAYVGYHRQIIHYTANPASPTKNSKNHLVDLGVEGEIAPKVTGQVQFGGQHRRYDDAAFTGAQRDFRTWTAATNINYKPLERTKATLSLSRSLQEATFGRSQFYVASAVGLNVVHRLPGKLTATLGGGFEQDRYSEVVTLAGFTGHRRDDLYQAIAGLTYDIQPWLQAGVTHMYRTRHSNGLSEQFNYKNHISGVTIGATF